MKFQNHLYIILLSSGLIFSQNIKLEGVIIDSLGVAISTANIVAKNLDTDRMDNFAISDLDGKFSFGIKKDTPYNIKVSYLGFKPVDLEVRSSEDVNQVFVMFEQAQQLDGVEVTYEMPVSIQGDTIIYNADSFNTGTEKKLKDVLENLPGVEINDDGQIEVEGKQVKKLMVEGKDFFDGDSKIATENIPSSAVDKVQVLKNFSEVSQLGGVTNNEDNIAINIKLKQGKSKFWFGDLMAGGGEKNTFLLNPKVFYYSPQLSINFLGNSNNLGENPFTRRDYYKFTGGFRTQSNKSGSSIQIQSNDIGLQNLSSNNAEFIDNDFAASNFSFSPKEGLDFSGFAIVSQNTTKIKSLRDVTFTSNGANELTNNTTNQISRLQLYKFSTLYKPNLQLQLEYDILFREADESEDRGTISTSSFTENINELRSQKPNQINQNLNSYYTLNDNHIFSLEIQHSFQEENPIYFLQKEQIIFPQILPLDPSISPFNVQQNRITETNQIDGRLDYYYVLNKKSNLNLTLGTTRVKQDYLSEMSTLNDNIIFSFDDEKLKNDISFSFIDNYTSLHYRFKDGKITFNPGITLHNYKIDTNDNFRGVLSDSEIRILPDIWVSYKLKESETLRFTYNSRVRFSDVSRRALGYTFNNYNSLRIGNEAIKPAYFNDFSLNYFNFNMFNFTNIFARANYSRQFDSLKSSFLLDGINRINTPFNSPKDEESISFNGNIQKRFNKLKVSTGGSINSSKYYNVVNENLREFQYLTQSIRGSIATNFNSGPNFEIGFNYNVNKSKDETRIQHYITERPFINTDIAFLNGFVFFAEYSFFDYRIGSQSLNNYDDSSFSLSYNKKDSKWEFAIEGKNLLDNGTINRDNFSGIVQSSTTFFVQPRFIYFTLKYKL
ncbi:MAG: TonB-dependent receptor [Flavobacteriaceae bacterium]|nr:TonB-dependent receptor [Flavobacteriaceae bacterium]